MSFFRFRFRDGWMSQPFSVAIAVLLGGLIGLPLSTHAQSESDEVVVGVENPSATARSAEVVSVDWSDVASVLDDGEQVRVHDQSTGEEVPVQVLDSNGDGAPEELLFLADFRGGEARHFAIQSASSTPSVEAHVDAYHQEERDDIAWENRQVAFRTYGEGLREIEADFSSSGIDVWMKRVSELVIEDWYAEGHYHTDTGEGADFYSVGETLGSGGTALWQNGQLHRAPNFSDYQIVVDGPLRAIIELEYGPWDAGGLSVTEHKRITIDAGEHFFRSESTFETEGADSLTYATGIVKRDGAVGSTKRGTSWAWLSLWGPVATGSGGHGDLGTAVVIDRDRLVDITETDDHYLARASVAAGEPMMHYVGTGWTAAAEFEDVADWWQEVEGFIQRLRDPLRVTVDR